METERPALENRRFDAAALDVLLKPQSWRIITVPLAGDPARPSRRKKRAGHKRHRHSSADAMLVLNGAARFEIEGRRFEAGPGTVFFLRPGQWHQTEYPRGARALWISLIGDTVLCWEATRRRSPSTPTRVAPPNALTSEQLGFNLTRHLAALQRPNLPEALHTARIRALMELVVAALVERGYDPPPRHDASTHHQRVVHAIMEHIRQTAGRDISLESLAHVAGYSKYHLHRIFREHAGKTIHAYVEDCRRNRERELLAEGRQKKFIAEALGFSSPQAYSRWRRKIRHS